MDANVNMKVAALPQPRAERLSLSATHLRNQREAAPRALLAAHRSLLTAHCFSRLDPTTLWHHVMAARSFLSRSKPRLGCRQRRHAFGDKRRWPDLAAPQHPDQRESARCLFCQREDWLAG